MRLRALALLLFLFGCGVVDDPRPSPVDGGTVLDDAGTPPCVPGQDPRCTG